MDNQVDLMGTLLTIHQASVKPFKIKVMLSSMHFLAILSSVIFLTFVIEWGKKPSKIFGNLKNTKGL